jgi:ligand-binding sensor domain-containing protein
MVDRCRFCKTIIYFTAMLMAAGCSVLALDPSSLTSGFIRDDFTVENGLPSNVVNAIVQTRNGFLWIGTDAGLVRFNGRQFIPIYFRAPQPDPQGIVHDLAEGPDGDLWVGTGAGLARIAHPALDFFDQSQSVFYHPGAGLSDEITCLLLVFVSHAKGYDPAPLCSHLLRSS